MRPLPTPPFLKRRSKMETCEICGAMLLDWEIDNCDGLCGDCCEEQHLDDDSTCSNMLCPYTKCNAIKEEI